MRYLRAKAYIQVKLHLFGDDTEKEVHLLSNFSLKLVQGYVVGQDYSGVDGILINNLFFGSVFVEDKVYFVDPSDSGTSQEISVYQDPIEVPINLVTLRRTIEALLRPTIDTYLKKLKVLWVNRSKREIESLTYRKCNIAIIIDHLFFKEVGQSNVEQVPNVFQG